MPPYASVTSTDFTYTGQRDLPDTGLMDYDARFYSPTLGRFIQPDTIIPNAANSQNWNRYSYVLNNPIMLNDPTGHDPYSTCGGNSYCMSYIEQHPEQDVFVVQAKLKKKDKEKDKDPSSTPPITNTPQLNEIEEQVQFCIAHPNYPECDIPEQATLRPLPIHFTPIFPWQLDHLDAYGIIGDITGCFIIICGTTGVSWVHNKWGEDTVFFNYGGGGGLGFGYAGSVGGILAYDAPYNRDLAGLATNYGANVTVGQGGQVTYANSASPNVTGNYAQTYTASYSLGGEASAHNYVTNSVPLFTCIFGKDCQLGVP